MSIFRHASESNLHDAAACYTTQLTVHCVGSDDDEDHDVDTRNRRASTTQLGNMMQRQREQIGDDNPAPHEMLENSEVLSHDLRYLAGCPELCDVTFLVGEARDPVYAVRAILAVRSRVFHRMFFSNIKVETSTNTKQFGSSVSSRNRRSISMGKMVFGNNIFKAGNISLLSRGNNQLSLQPTTSESDTSKSVITINDFDVEVFRQLIHYVHTGAILLQPKTVIGLMNASDHYGIDELRDACIRYSQRCISLDSVCYLLTSAEKYIQYKSTKMLIQKVLEYVDRFGEAVLRLNDLIYLPRHIMELILSREDLQANELTKFQAAERWAHHQSTKLRPEVSFRQILTPFMKHIAFHQVPTNYLMQKIRPLRVVPDEILMKALAYQADPASITAEDISNIPMSPRTKLRLLERAGSAEFLRQKPSWRDSKRHSQSICKSPVSDSESRHYEVPCIDGIHSPQATPVGSVVRRVCFPDEPSPCGSCSDSGIQEAEFASMLRTTPSPNSSSGSSRQSSQNSSDLRPPPPLKPRLVGKKSSADQIKPESQPRSKSCIDVSTGIQTFHYKM